MKILFDMVHPADVLFYQRPIAMLQADGADIAIASRHKDITCDLLDRMGIAHTPISTAGKGMIRLGAELLLRDLRLLGMARRFKPDVITGFGGVAASHVGKLLGIPSVAFYDSDHANLQIGLTVPFITEWHVPANWRGKEARGRTHRVPSFKELSRLHPAHFTPDANIARQLGWEPERDNFFIRLVAWQAAHDHGVARPCHEALARNVAELAAHGRVHVSGEGALPAELEPYRYTGDPLLVHHLLGKCRLYLGESATMAAEAAVLGVPAICMADFILTYIEDMTASGMVVPCLDAEKLAPVIAETLARPADHWRACHTALLKDKIDMAEHVTSTLRRLAGHGTG